MEGGRQKSSQNLPKHLKIKFDERFALRGAQYGPQVAEEKNSWFLNDSLLNGVKKQQKLHQPPIHVFSRWMGDVENLPKTCPYHANHEGETGFWGFRDISVQKKWAEIKILVGRRKPQNL